MSGFSANPACTALEVATGTEDQRIVSDMLAFFMKKGGVNDHRARKALQGEKKKLTCFP